MISDSQTALGSCNLVEHIVNDVLDLKKLEEDKLTLVEKNVIVSDFIIQFNKCIKQKLNEKPQITYEVNADETIQIICVDPMRLTQILLNYFTNSIKFTDEGKICLNIYRHSGEIRFELSDTGRGIKDEDRSKVFKQFVQLDENDSARHRGFGLGLYLCNMLAKRMNGTVGYESVFGMGSNFWVQIKETGSSDHFNENISHRAKLRHDDHPSINVATVLMPSPVITTKRLSVVQQK
jgi:signal transduction histidine kinase